MGADINSNTTPSRIISVVIFTAALMSVIFFATLAVLCVTRMEPNERVFTAFTTAGMSAMSFLFGVLVNTRQPPTPVPGQVVASLTKEVTSTTQETSVPVPPQP